MFPGTQQISLAVGCGGKVFCWRKNIVRVVNLLFEDKQEDDYCGAEPVFDERERMKLLCKHMNGLKILGVNVSRSFLRE